MAETGNTTKRSFYEVVFRGKPKVVRAFISGLLLGSGHEASIYFNFLHGVFHEGRGEKLAELVGFRADDCHMIVDGQTSALIKKLGKRIATETGLEITAHRSIRSAGMKFCFQTFAPAYDQEIVNALKNLPRGLRLEDFKHDVKLNPQAKGVESYAPAHDYEGSGKGEIKGRIDLLIEFREQMVNYPLIKAEQIRLKLA